MSATDAERREAKVAMWLAHLLTTEADSLFYGDHRRNIPPARPDSPEHEQACYLSDQADVAHRMGTEFSSRIAWRDALDAF